MPSLILTKLAPPPLPTAMVPRLRLVARLNEVLQPGRRLALVSAPAGFGKTSLVLTWLAEAGCSAAWLSLDQADDDVVRFAAYLVAALRSLLPSVGEGLESAMASLQPPEPGAWLTVLINQVSAAAGASRDPVVLVLDDLHCVTAPEIHTIVEGLLTHSPEPVRIVIVTRADPPLPLSRFRGRGQLVEVRQADLRFDEVEAAAYLKRRPGTQLTPEQIAAIVARTEGWVAGLQMVAASWWSSRGSVGGTPGAADLPEVDVLAGLATSHHQMIDYLGDEVLDRLPPHLRRFLLSTSVVERFTAPLCDALIAGDAVQGQSHELISALVEGNLFISPVDRERRWYRYHGLFRDLLRQRLVNEVPGSVPELHRRAAQWMSSAALGEDGRLGDAAMLGEAFRHAPTVGDPEFLAQLLEARAEELLLAGEIGGVLRAAASLPVGGLRGRPTLGLYQSVACVTAGRLDEADRALTAAEAALAEADQPGRDASLSAKVAAMRATLAYLLGDAETVISLAHRALDDIARVAGPWRGATAMVLGDAYTLRGDLVRASEAYDTGLQSTPSAGNVFLHLLLRLKLADTWRGLGQLRRAMVDCERQATLASSLGLKDTARYGGILALQGEVLRERGQLGEALRLLQRAVDLAEAEQHIPLLVWMLPFTIHLHASRGDDDALSSAMAHLERVTHRAEAPVWAAARLAAWRARAWIACGEPDALAGAEDLLAARGLSAHQAAPDVHDYVREEECLALVRLLIARGDAASALGRLDRLLPSARAGGRLGREIEMRALQAIARAGDGDEAGALEGLERALNLGEAAGYVQTYVDEGAPLAAHLMRFVTLGAGRGLRTPALAFAERLLASFPLPDENPPRTGGEALIEPLSDRELEVLRCLASGATNSEIAEELVIARNTVKKHVSNILGKLVVSNRREAVRRARALNLIP